MTINHADRWDALALQKGPMRAAWDEDIDLTEECVQILLGELPRVGILWDVGCGPGRLTVPVADARPDTTIFGIDVSRQMLAGSQRRVNVTYLTVGSESPTEWQKVTGRPLTGVWSVLTFQHLDELTIHRYIQGIAESIAPNGRFILQFCEGTGDYFPLTQEWVMERFEDNRMKTYSVVEGAVRDVWTWVMARKL